MNFTFRRARRVPERAVCSKKKQRAQKALLHLHHLEDAGRCQVPYGDESGFCLSPVVPYLWQMKGKMVGLPAKAHSRRLNVLGFLSRQSHLHHFQTQERITATFVMESIEALLPTLCRPTVLPAVLPTVLVLDNASVHRSKLVQAKRKEWKQKGLRLLFLPPYCPHLNLIETLWRQVKSRWLGCDAYRTFETLCQTFETLCQTFETLCQSVTDILAQVGAKYRLSFA